MKRRLAGLGVAVALVGVVAARVVVEGRREWLSGQALAVSGDSERAIEHLRRAARWHLPGSPYPALAMDALETLGQAAEARGQTRLARRAREAIRGAILSTRSFYVPESARLDPTNRKIAALLALEEGDAADPGKGEAARTAYHLELLRKDDVPRPGWSIVALLGFGAFLLGALAFCFRALTPEDRLDRRAALVCGSVIVVGFACFLLGLMRA